MRFTIVRSKLLEALLKTQNVVGSRSTIKILENVLIKTDGDHLMFTTTDLDISVRCRVEAKIVEEGSITLPVRRLAGIVRELPETEIDIVVGEDDLAVIQCGSSLFKMIALPENDFPPIPEPEETSGYKIGVGTLREMLRKTSYAVSTDETRRILTGILMSFRDGKLTMVATDGRRLAMVENEVEFPPEAEAEFVLPYKSASELMRVLDSGDDEDVKVMIQNAQTIFECGDTRISTKLLDGTYPNYRQVIPEGCDERVVIMREELITALRRVSHMKTDRSPSACLTFNDNLLTIVWQNIDVGEAIESVPIKYSGKEISITFNPDYIMDPMRNLATDEIYFEISNSHSPALIKCEEPFLYVLMPLRVNA